MLTEPLYLEDPYLKSQSCIILQCNPVTSGEWQIIFDKTIFYPIGGGQPTDQGKIRFDDGASGQVYKVQLQDGEIYHIDRNGRRHDDDQVRTCKIDDFL